VSIRLDGRDVTARPELVREPGEVEQLVTKVIAANPRATSVMPFVGPDRRIDQAALTTAIEHGFCVVRWHLGGGAGGAAS
jgi:hypothetical protein